MYTVKTILSPKLEDINFLIPFLNIELQKRKHNSSFDENNYKSDSTVGLVSLVREGRFNSGGISILYEEDSILAASGFYNANSILICGVRTIVKTALNPREIGLHAKYVLNEQRSFAIANNCLAIAITFNANNFRIIDWIEKNKSANENLKIFHDFSILNSEVIFNNTKQKILFEILSKNLNETAIFTALNNYLFKSTIN